MVCHVADDDRPEWRVGVEDPHDPTRVLAVIPVRRGAVATSGHAHRGHHVVDARTGRPPGDVASVTVVFADLTWADLDATAAYALGAGAPPLAAHPPGPRRARRPHRRFHRGRRGSGLRVGGSLAGFIM
jgi:thiamine biosynthesis lipoprotein